MPLSRRWLFVLVLGCVLAATPAQESASVDLERNRQLLQKWKADPDHAARLERDLRAFWSLSAAKRERMRRLDRDLHELDVKSQKKLWRVVERYSVWLDQQSEDQRQQIESASTSKERLRLIEEARDRQWIERLPLKVREGLLNLSGEARTTRLAQLREQGLRQRKLWQRPLGAASPGAKQPTRLSDFPKDVKEFVETHLRPRLTPDEEAHYRQAEGHWPAFPLLLMHLSERHPVLPPLPAPHRPITRYEDLTDNAKREAGPKISWERRVEDWKKLQKVEGKWPEWAETFVSLLDQDQRTTVPPLGASRPSEFPPTVHTFIETTLKTRIKPFEFKNLRATEGKWPDYPRRLLDLAHKYNLRVPDMSLPGSEELWQEVRKK